MSQLILAKKPLKFIILLRKQQFVDPSNPQREKFPSNFLKLIFYDFVMTFLHFQCGFPKRSLKTSVVISPERRQVYFHTNKHVLFYNTFLTRHTSFTHVRTLKLTHTHMDARTHTQNIVKFKQISNVKQLELKGAKNGRR